MNRRDMRIPALWLCCVAGASMIVVRARYVTDLSAFLPAKPTPVQQLLVDQLRDGPASRLILIAIEQGDAGARAGVSALVASRLRGDRQFSSINNGEPVTAERDRQFLFQHRYLLSDSVSGARFSASGLHAAIEDTIEELASPAGLMLKSLLPNDPTGEMLHIIDQLQRTPSPATRDGVWVSADGARALMVAQTAAAGSDTDAQEHATEAIHTAFAAAIRESSASGANALRLRQSGPGLYEGAFKPDQPGVYLVRAQSGAQMVTAGLVHNPGGEVSLGRHEVAARIALEARGLDQQHLDVFAPRRGIALDARRRQFAQRSERDLRTGEIAQRRAPTTFETTRDHRFGFVTADGSRASDRGGFVVQMLSERARE